MRADSCKYFTGTQAKTCEKGVVYRALVGGLDVGWVRRLPCFTFKPEDKAEQVTCEYFYLPRAEDLAESEKEIARVIEMMTKVNPLIAKFKRENYKRSAQEIFECPVCGGRLHMSIAALNGHVHGQCETENCVAWME